MTDEEKRQQMETRNEMICAQYQAGDKIASIAKRFRLNRNRVSQIVKAAGIWKPYERGDRTGFVGVNVREETKAALQTRAESEGKSVSQFASDVLDAAVGNGK